MAGSALASGAGLSHLHFPPAVISDFGGTASGFTASGFTATGFGATASQQLFAFFGASSDSQQLVFLGGGGSGFGSEQQHAAAACKTTEHEQEAEPVLAQAPDGVGSNFADAATGSATAGVNWPMRARTARAIRR